MYHTLKSAIIYIFTYFSFSSCSLIGSEVCNNVVSGLFVRDAIEGTGIAWSVILWGLNELVKVRASPFLIKSFQCLSVYESFLLCGPCADDTFEHWTRILSNH